VGQPGAHVEKILVIEDDRAVQRALKRLFESEGYGVQSSFDGPSGLEAFRAAPPGMVVLDLRLPGISGNDVCRSIKESSPSLPVIVLSAAADVTDKVLLLELGADDYVTKPFSPRELLARVRVATRSPSCFVLRMCGWTSLACRSRGTATRSPVRRRNSRS
jgi:DNA-binding response OmpR family regulator